MYNYPNPCDTCTQECVSSKYGCSDWIIRFYTIWKQFNTYPLRQYKNRPVDKTVYAYEHPDVLRKYLEEGPCKRCKSENDCDIPCTAYWCWWDARMALLKKKYGME